MRLSICVGTVFALGGLAFDTEAAQPAGVGPALDSPPSQADRDAYAKHLRQTKGILDIRTVHRAGSGPTFLDLVVVSAGFTADQMGDFHAVCERFVKTLFSTQPWQRYRNLVNVHAVFVGDKGVDSSRLKVDGYDGHVLGCDDALAVEYARCAAPAAGTLVIHNSGNACGSTGTWGVATIHKGEAQEPTASVHELGHGLAGLGDEYIQRDTPFDDDPNTLWNTVNVTATPNARLCKWHYWTQDRWPGLFVPSLLPKGAKVANYEGAGWIKRIYRPEETCIMRGDRDSFCVVCQETMEACLYRYIELFKACEPASEDIVLWKGELVDVYLSAIDMLRAPPGWLKSRLNLYLDGRKVAGSDRGEVRFRLSSTDFAPGIHQLGANLNVQSDTVRRDFGFLSANRSWRVTILPWTRPRIVLPSQVEVPSGGAVDVHVEIKHEEPAGFELTMAHAPPGAVLDKGRFRWKPAVAAATGSWRADFTLWHEGHSAATGSMRIDVAPASGTTAAVDVASPRTIDAETGRQVRVRLKAKASDGCHLLFEPVHLATGAQLDRDTGELSWTPRTDQAGPQRMRVRVHNGPATHEVDVLFWVRRTATPTPVSFCNDYIPRTMEALKQLRQCPIAYRRLFETLRLLRDRYEPVHQKVLVEAKAMYEELDPKLHSNCLEELQLHAWEFADNPGILKWLREIVQRERSDEARSLNDTLDRIDRYNAERARAK